MPSQPTDFTCIQPQKRLSCLRQLAVDYGILQNELASHFNASLAKLRKYQKAMPAEYANNPQGLWQSLQEEARRDFQKFITTQDRVNRMCQQLEQLHGADFAAFLPPRLNGL